MTIKRVVVKNMYKITLIMVVVILFLSAAVQVFSMRRTNAENAQQIFEQVRQILEENSRELERIQAEYAATCLNNARTVAYILEYNPGATDSVEELKKLASNLEVDEIHIFNTDGEIVAGTHPEYWGYTFDSGEQMRFFKPLLSDRSLKLVQDITPNTAEGKLVQYSALWSESGEFIVQIGMEPSNVLRATEKNELSYIFSLLRTGVGYRLYAINPELEQVVGATNVSDVNKSIAEVGFDAEAVQSDRMFYAEVDQTTFCCLSRQIGENYIVWATPLAGLYHSIFNIELLLLAGLLLTAAILVWVVANTMERAVIGQITRVNRDLRLIQNGDLKTKVDVNDSREFSELSAHINGMVDSLLQSSEKLELSKKIESQKEELERQHEQLEEALLRAEEASSAKTEFLFNMSHDIRTPMNAILGFTSLALESESPETQREYLKNIDAASKQLLDLINNILELSRIEKKKIVIEEELTDVREYANRLCTIVDGDLKKKRLACTVQTELEHPFLYVDTTHYAQIFLNIVGNAIKYTPDGGKISISFRELKHDAPDTCLMETVIEDSGIGMSEEFQAHAFESFARERTSTVSGQQGTGLGLAIVKNLAERMGGTVDIASRQGAGTRVTVRLPHRIGTAPAEKKQQPAQAPAGAPLEGRRILLVEDIDINAMIATKLLTSRGCRVDRAKDGVECVDMLLKAAGDGYDLVLMDIQMPNMDGYEAARTIRRFEDRKKASVPILAMTANAFQEDREKALEAGMDGHIAKPIDAAAMLRTIAETLEKNGT